MVLRLLSLSWISLFITFFTGCRSDSASGYSSFMDFDDKGLSPGMQYMILPVENIDEDILKDTKFSTSLVVRYTDKCKIRELPLNLEYILNRGDSIGSEDIKLTLFDKEEDYFGRGNYSLYQKEIKLADSILLDDDAFVSIATFDKNTAGIVSMGIVCRPLKD